MRDPNDDQILDIEGDLTMEQARKKRLAGQPVGFSAQSSLPAALDPANLERLVDARQQAQVRFSEQVGQVRAFDFQRKVGWIATLKILAEIKEQKTYKGMSLINAAGEVINCKTWEDLCTATGYTRQKVDEDLLALDVLGGEFLETARAMKLGQRDIQKLRKLPENDRALVLGNIEVDVGDKSAIIDLIDDLAAKHAREKAELQAQLEKATARVDAVVAEETKGLVKERDALVQERDHLQSLLEEPAWNKARDHAKLLGQLADDLRAQMDTFLQVIPLNQEPPANLEIQVDAHVFRAFSAVETAQRRWENKKTWKYPEQED